MREKIQQVKKHLAENKVAYISSGVVAVAAFGAGIAVSPQAVTIVDSFKVTLMNFSWKSPTTNITTTIVLKPRGHRGNKIRCVETGKWFASQNEAAAAMGISASNLSQHLGGKYAHAGGFHFENHGENL